MSKSVNNNAKVKPYVTSQSLRSIYYALIYPYLTYGCAQWGNNYEAPLSQLMRLQNKGIRIINNVPLRDHITPYYVNLGLINLPDIVKLYTCQLVHDHCGLRHSELSDGSAHAHSPCKILAMGLPLKTV